MKIFTLLSIVFLSLLVYAGIEYSTGITGVTQKNGDGCTCHNLTPNPSVWVRIEGPDTLLQGQTAQFIVKLSGGPAVAGGFNVASYSGLLSPDDAGIQLIGNELTHSSPRLFTDSVMSWTFSFTAGNNNYVDTIYSVANSVNGNGNPSGDEWNFGIKFPVTVLDVIPVELASFSAKQLMNSVILRWSTITELNNDGFEVERRVSTTGSISKWEKIGFIRGNGTTTNKTDYTYTDEMPVPGTSYYRLKQIDYDGSYTYSDEVEIVYSEIVSDFILNQNYPNPFNPSTIIVFNLKESGKVTLTVYDVLGIKLQTLVNEVKPSGSHQIVFNASGLSSGIYYYTLQTGNSSETKKMLLLK